MPFYMRADNIDPENEADVAKASGELAGLGVGSMGAMAADLSKVVPKAVWNWGSRYFSKKGNNELYDEKNKELMERASDSEFAAKRARIAADYFKGDKKKLQELQEAADRLEKEAAKHSDRAFEHMKNWQDKPTITDHMRAYKMGQRETYKPMEDLFGTDQFPAAINPLLRGRMSDAVFGNAVKKK